jgi:hypothetical protein
MTRFITIVALTLCVLLSVIALEGVWIGGQWNLPDLVESLDSFAAKLVVMLMFLVVIPCGALLVCLRDMIKEGV